jgi:hypothetical protein
MAEQDMFSGIDRSFAAPIVQGPQTITDIKQALDRSFSDLHRRRAERRMGPVVVPVTQVEFTRYLDAGLIDKDGRVR